jgi:membrane protease YdiL (CAAX protease family)
VQYLPAGLALAWAYEKADTIWAPILMHMTINQISITFMR